MISQKNGKWFVQVDRKGFKRVRKSFALKRDAEAFERGYLSSVNVSGVVVPVDDDRRLSDLVDLWFTLHGVNLSDGVRRKAILTVMAAKLGNPVARLLSPALFLEYRFTCLHSNEKKIAAKTLNNRLGYLVAVFSVLFKLGVIDYQCPIARVDFIKIHERQLGYLSTEQINILFDALLNDCRNKSTWWIAQICIRTGARWGEVESLKRKQIQIDRVTFEFTKSKKIRTVPIDQHFISTLLVFCKSKHPDERIFCDSITAFNRSVGRANLDFQVGQKTHILRHTFASYFVINGGNILTLQKILGHSDIKMTMRYAHLAPDHLMDAVRLNPLANLPPKVAVN